MVFTVCESSEILPTHSHFCPSAIHNFTKVFTYLLKCTHPYNHLTLPNFKFISVSSSTPSFRIILCRNCFDNFVPCSNLLYKQNGQQMSSDWLPSLPGSSIYQRLLLYNKYLLTPPSFHKNVQLYINSNSVIKFTPNKLSSSPEKKKNGLQCSNFS